MNRRLLIAVAGVALVLLAVGSVLVAGAMGAFAGPLTPAEAGLELDSLLRGTVDGNAELHNGVLRVDAPDLGVEGAWAAGVADERDGTPMTTATPFLSASIGKLFTAATVLSLADDGLLSLDDPITERLSPDVYSGLPVEGGDAALRDVTVRMLLGQRSGIPDYYDGATTDGAPNVFALLVDEPNREWTPLSLLAYTKAHFKAAGAPGEDFQYSDTNYDLLGLIVEKATGRPFHEVVAERVLVPLALRDTWYHAREDPPRPGLAPYADVWIGDTNVAHEPALSLDWAGGGLATTTADLDALMRGLVDGKPVPLEALEENWTENSLNRGIDYGYGLWRIRPAGVFFLLRGYPVLYGVSGSSGTFVYYVPKYDAVITGAFDQTDYAEGHVRFLLQVLALLGRVERRS
ncbi:MAG: serine hydrolase domain-containing protein [Anaerolineae bacterium]